ETRNSVEHCRDEVTLSLEQRRLPLRFTPLLEHLNECGDFRSQDIWRKRFKDVIDAAQEITLADMDIAFTDRRQKDNGSMFGLIAVANQRSRLESVHVGHFNIEQNNGDFIPQKILQRLHARSRF